MWLAAVISDTRSCVTLCVRVQAGVWDVDGTGMQAINDPEVDLGIRKVRDPCPCLCLTVPDVDNSIMLEVWCL